MAVFHPYTVQCACGNPLTVLLAQSIDVRRMPDARERILKGELHRAACSSCGRQMIVEKPFYYSDFGRNLLFKVLPRGERHRWKSASGELDKAAALIPDAIAGEGGRTLRVVFGMDELREKLVAQDAGIDDRVLELLKVLVLYEHPVLLRQARLRLTLDRATDGDLSFIAAYEHGPRKFQVDLPRPVADQLTARQPALQDWAGAHKQPVFALPDHWVNLWRWSPQPTALDRLRSYAGEVEAGRPIDVAAPAFQQMLSGIPRGSHLPDWAKRDLRTLLKYAKASNLQALEDQLFEIRFGVELEDDWSVNSDVNDIDTLWDLLKDLPDSNVEGNTRIHEIMLNVGSGGGLYDPSSHDISIGSNELANKERFQDVVRHEVGHAVHEMRSDLVNGYLDGRFGWKIFGTRDADIDGWVGLMGGWGTLTATQKGEVRAALRTAIGTASSWQPGPTPSLPPGHPWHRPDFGPRLACEKTPAYWYRGFREWYRANGYAFFLNYWYKTLIAVKAETLDLVARMPDAYAAMSQFEFFAELYALYYDLDDPQRAQIPADVGQWFDSNIGSATGGAPMPAAPREIREWETIVRPAKA